MSGLLIYGRMAETTGGTLPEMVCELEAEHRLRPALLEAQERTAAEMDRLIRRISPAEAARERQQKIKDRGAEWLWQDDARRERLVGFYTYRTADQPHRRSALSAERLQN